MVVETKTLRIETKSDLDLVDITDDVQKVVQGSGIKNGIVTIFIPGSTAGISTIEFEPHLLKDISKTIERIIPSDLNYEHDRIDNNAKSHLRATLFKPSLSVPFKDKKLLLGTWQQIVLMDFDVPARNREIILQIMGE